MSPSITAMGHSPRTTPSRATTGSTAASSKAVWAGSRPGRLTGHAGPGSDEYRTLRVRAAVMNRSPRERSECEAAEPPLRSSTGGLEQFDGIAGRILKEDLLAANPDDDIVAEEQARRAQVVDLCIEVRDRQRDPVPAPRFG